MNEEFGITANNVKPYMTKKHINKENIQLNLNFFIIDDYQGIPYS
ncbi:hypothetical protein NAI59_12255 [Francisella tularensis subsp. holarctica]|nr:hypothetical protein [Francisella tularensis subsp. holarctica]